MNKLSKIILAACIAVLVLVAALLIRGCGNNAPETPVTMPVETEIADPTDYTLDPDGSYVIGGVEDVEWDDENSTEAPTETPTEAPTEEPTEAPTEGPEETTPVEPQKTAYETFMNMSADQQEAFMESFDSVDAFIDWLKAAKQEYQNAADNSIIVDGKGPIDMEDVFG